MTLDVSALKPDSTFKTDLMLDNQFVICVPPCPLTKELIKSLIEWGFKEVQSASVSIVETKAENVDEEQLPDSKKQKSFDIEEADDVSDMFIEKKTDPALVKIKDTIFELEKEEPAEEGKMDFVRSLYNEYMNYINQVYLKYSTHKLLNYDEIYSTVKHLCNFVKSNYQFMLRVTPDEEEYMKNMIVNHSMKCTVLAITIAQQLKMPEGQIVELGVAALLHEIGQIRIPPQFYATAKPLSPSERAQLNTHPILSYNILKDSGFPQNIQVAVLEHHEKENGQGYPRRLTGDKISLYSKIIAAACSFEAITSPRLYKDETKTYAEMSKFFVNEGGPYNPAVLKALLISIQMHQPGSYVYLSNGQIAQVVDSNQSDPKNPVVAVIDSDGNKQTIKTSEVTIKVVRPLTKQEQDDYLASIKK